MYLNFNSIRAPNGELIPVQPGVPGGVPGGPGNNYLNLQVRANNLLATKPGIEPPPRGPGGGQEFPANNYLNLRVRDPNGPLIQGGILATRPRLEEGAGPPPPPPGPQGQTQGQTQGAPLPGGEPASTAGLQPSPQGYKAIYACPIALYFGSSTNPKWDPALNESIKGCIGEMTPEKIFQATKSILQKYSVELMIPVMKVGPNSGLKALVQQYIEVMQLFFCYKRNMQNGPRNSTVGVAIGDLQKFGSLLGGSSLADQTATPTPPVRTATQAVTAEQQRVADAIQPSLTKKVFLDGAIPLEKSTYFRGQPRASIVINSAVKGIITAGVNTGASSRYGRAGRLVVPDSKNNVVRFGRDPSTLRVDDSKKSGCVINMD